jgi:hypothetical protein
MPKDHGTLMILQAMPDQSNYQLELPQEIYRATSLLGALDLQMPYNGSSYNI